MNKNIINVDLKTKITELFGDISPDNKQLFYEQMNKIDIMTTSKELDNSENTNIQSGDIVKGDVITGGMTTDDFSDIELDDEELEEIKKIQEKNTEFKNHAIQNLEYEIVENFALPESKIVYRDDEIISELVEYFREEKDSKTFANEEKVELWVNDLMNLIKKNSIIEIDRLDETKQYIKGHKEVSSNYKPILESYENGKGTDSKWLTPLVSEKRKIYGAGEVETDYTYSVEQDVEVNSIYKILDAKSNQGVERFINYDIQQKKLYELNKVSTITEDLEFNLGVKQQECQIELEKEYQRKIQELENRTVSEIEFNKLNELYLDEKEENTKLCIDKFTPKTLVSNDEVYYIYNEDNVLSKRVLDKGLSRIENVYKVKETEKKSKQKSTLGVKKIIGQRDVNIIDPEKVYVSGFVAIPPGYKNKKQFGSLFRDLKNEVIPDTHKVNKTEFSKIIPFRKLKDEYVVFEYNIPKRDYLGLKQPINDLLIDKSQVSISNLNVNDKVVIRISFPNLIDSDERIVTPVRPEDVIVLENYNVPIHLHILVKVSKIEIPKYDSTDELYHYDDGTISSSKNIKFYVTPMINGGNYMNDFWFDDSILINSPNIIYKFSCDCENLKENDKAVIYLTDLYKQKLIDGLEISRVSNKNPYFVGKLGKKEVEFLNEKNENYYTIQVISKSSNEIEFIIEDINVKLKLSIEEFKLIFISKNVNSINIIEKSIKSLIKNIEKQEVTYVSNLDKKNTIDVWGKVIGIYNKLELISEKHSDTKNINQKTYLIQSISPCSKPIGTFFLIKEQDIKYSIIKKVFERNLLGKDTSLIGWFKGIFLENNVEELVPNLDEFLNKITKILRKKDSINYNFIHSLLKLVLNYDDNEITSQIKEKINNWVEWNIIKHIETRCIELEKIRLNYINVINDYLENDTLNPEKFKLTRNISPKLYDYKNWNVKLDEIDWSKVRNKKLLEVLNKEHIKNVQVWNNCNRNELSYLQKKELDISKVKQQEFNKIYNQYEKVQKENVEKTREQKIIELILRIEEPYNREKLLTNFIENNCYLREDTRTKQLWFYSKIDPKKTRLLCPHVYDELKNRSLEKYEVKLDDGSIICKNCGQVLNSISFSYFQGYGEEAMSRGNVIEIDGVEQVGTMDDMTVKINIDEPKVAIQLVETIFKPEEYVLENVLEKIVNSLLKYVPDVRIYLGSTEEGLKLKRNAILDIKEYTETDVTSRFDEWKNSSKDKILRLLKQAILRDEKAKKDVNKQRELSQSITTNLYKQESEQVKLQGSIARLAILIEKELPSELLKNANETIINVTTQKLDELKLTRNLQSYLDGVKIAYLTYKERYPKIQDLYKIVSTVKESIIEDQYKEFTEININEDLSLYDSIEWLKSHLRNIHKGDSIAIKEEEDIQCGLVKKETYTSEEKLELFRKIENAIDEKTKDRYMKSTGVKSRKQFYSNKKYVLPKIESNQIESVYICKNLFGSTNESHLEKVKNNLIKYRYIDYLITYKIENNKLIPRLYENGIDIETNKTRNELIQSYEDTDVITLKEQYDELKSKSIKQELPKVGEKCEEYKLDLSLYNSVIDKLIENLKIVLDVKDFREVSVLLKYLGREYKINKVGQIILDIDTIKEKDGLKGKKEILLKEFENLNKVFSTFKRDYNYLVNNYDVKLRLDKLRVNLGIDLESDFYTEYDYLIKYTNMENVENRKNLVHLKEELKIIEEVSCDSDENDISLLENRNKKNVMLFYIILLKLLTQFKENWFYLKNEVFLNNLGNVQLDEEDSENEQYRYLGNFIIDFIKNITSSIYKQNEVLKGIKSYKQDIFELHRQVESKKMSKRLGEIGKDYKDLNLEFNKVMKGKRKLGLEISELASDVPLEVAKQIRQDRYSSIPEDQYTTIDTNVIQGENEDITEEQMMDQMD